MDLERILVALNWPNGRQAPFARALALARSSGAELYLLQALSLDRRFSFREAERRERAADLRRRAEEAGVRVRVVEQRGDPAEIIELHANAREVDLIVMGGEPGRGWRSGSPVAERVIRRTKVPTLVVAGDGPGTPVLFENVLAAVDLSPASQAVVRGAMALTADGTGRLTVMHAVKGVAAADDARRSLETAVSAVPGALDAQLQISTGPAARAILDHVAAANADLVVVGRSQGVKMLGSTARRVVRNNDRALLVIPRDAQLTRRVRQQRAA